MRSTNGYAGRDWQKLWEEYGLEGLLEMHRRFGWFAGVSDRQAARTLVEWSLAAGYDPVSGLLGTYNRQNGTFSLNIDELVQRGLSDPRTLASEQVA
jgi:hypothetical protein